LPLSLPFGLPFRSALGLSFRSEAKESAVAFAFALGLSFRSEAEESV